MVDGDRNTTFTLAHLSLDEVSACADVIRGLGRTTEAMEEAAQEIVTYLHEHLVDVDGRPAAALVRLYKTHPFGELEPDLREFAVEVAGHELADDVRCLTLLGTAGDLPEWTSRHASRGHKAIPLLNEQMIERLPMVLELLTQLGIDLRVVVAPGTADVADLARRSYGVFHVQDVLGSPHIPAQEEFVVPYGIASAVGFGGVLYTGDLYAVVMFTKVALSAAVAGRLRILALPIRVPLLRFARGSVFNPAAASA